MIMMKGENMSEGSEEDGRNDDERKEIGKSQKNRQG